MVKISNILKVEGSSNITKLAYSASEKKLYVQFHNGSVYQYDDVEEEVFWNFSQAESKGSFLHKNIIGKYSYKKEK